MNINLKVHLNIEGSRSLSGGTFHCNSKEYKTDPDMTAAVVAYEINKTVFLIKN
jgi:hypothetical protein